MQAPAGVKKPELRPGSTTAHPVTLGLPVTSAPEPVPLYAQQGAAVPRHCTEMASEEMTHYIEKYFGKLKVLDRPEGLLRRIVLRDEWGGLSHFSV